MITYNRHFIENVHPTVSTQNYLNEYNLVTEYGYDALGNQIVVTDTLGRASWTFYDKLYRVDHSVDNYVDGVYNSNAPDEDIVTTYSYDANGNLISVFDVFSRETRTDYDALNRVSRTIQNYDDGTYDPNTPDQDLTIVYGYDALGLQTAITDTLGRVSQYIYDDLNRVQSVINPLNGSTSYTYDKAGRRLSVTDAEGRTSSVER